MKLYFRLYSYITEHIVSKYTAVAISLSSHNDISILFGMDHKDDFNLRYASIVGFLEHWAMKISSNIMVLTIIGISDSSSMLQQIGISESIRISL